MNADRLMRLLALGAGLLDVLSGVGFVVAPSRMLPLMGIPPPAIDAVVYIRFVGAMAAAVGATYLWGLMRGASQMRAALEVTLLFRFAAGIFCTVALARGWLPLGWIGVPLADAALIAAQLWLLRRGQASTP